MDGKLTVHENASIVPDQKRGISNAENIDVSGVIEYTPGDFAATPGGIIAGGSSKVRALDT